MKPFLEVEKDRKNYNKNPSLNTVHRSSLLVPRIANNKTCISFVNHFLLKRNYKDVVIKMTGYCDKGESGDSQTFPIDQAKVYSYCLEEVLGESYYCYQVEFFSSNNLFIPFSAVIINHISNNSINTVHSYNRILNDSREEDNVNRIHLKEASIDFASSDILNTFFIFQSGLMAVEDKFIELYLEEKNSGKKQIYKKVPISMNKMSIKKINLSELLYDELSEKNIIPGDFTLRILQPKQNMFYGRLLVGIEDLKTGGFSGNHSYYDNSEFHEYFDSGNSFRTFPYFSNAKNRLNIYPIMSNSSGEFSIYINYMEDGKIKSKLLTKSGFECTKSTLLIDIDDIIRTRSLEINNINTFTVIYSAKEKSKVPTRINMQLVYGALSENTVNASISISLFNESQFTPKGKGSYCWNQILNDKDYHSRLCFCFADKVLNSKNRFARNNIEFSLFDSKGCFLEKEISLNFLESYELDSKDITSNEKFIWCVAKSQTPNLQLFSFHTNLYSSYSSGEHNF